MALWGGRFSQSPADSVFALSRSVQFDWRLAPYDLVASMAHVRALHRGSIIDSATAEALDQALKDLAGDISSGRFAPIAEDEDVHTALERGLIGKIGEQGGAIRAGRSRNDQVVTAFKLYLMDAMTEIADLLSTLSTALLSRAEEHADTIAPGFTHLQHAQPISFGHELAKHAVSLERDIDRIQDWQIGRAHV